jgi:hypothetical protein
MEVKGKIVVKFSNGKSFKLSNNTMYTVDEKVIPFLAKVSKGDDVILEVTKKGTFNLVTKLMKNAVEQTEPEVTEEAEFKCEKCGAALKDDKYKTCWACSQKNKPSVEKTGEGTYVDKTAQIQRGNALNAAGAALSGNLQGADPDTIIEALITVAERALEWLRFVE